MTKNSDIVLGYDYDKWYGYGWKETVRTDISTHTNSHTLICGMSGSGKSYLTNQYLARLCLESGNGGQVYFADFKQDEQFSRLRECPRYYPYDRSLEALDIVYGILHKRQSGEDMSRVPITLIRLLISCQRPDAVAFPTGSRLNYGIIIIVGAPVRSIYEMLIPKEYIDYIGERQFGVGEGVVLLQGAEMHFIKVPLVRNEERMHQICIDALTR